MLSRAVLQQLRRAGRSSFRRAGAGRPARTALVIVAAAAATLAAPVAVQAQAFSGGTPGASSYNLEIEPHLVAGLADPPGRGVGQGAGAGMRGSLVVSHLGFMRNGKDSVAVGFGVDFLHYSGDRNSLLGSCIRREPGPGGLSVCTEVDVPGAPRNYVFIPVVMQWSVWATPQFSAFAEPGLAAFFASHGGGAGVAPHLALGGRFRPSEAVTLVLRIGWPTTTLGASFFF